MSNLITKTCDHQGCNKIYARDSNGWFWIYRFADSPVIYGQFGSKVTIEIEAVGNTEIDENSEYTTHFCGGEHLESGLYKATNLHRQMIYDKNREEKQDPLSDMSPE